MPTERSRPAKRTCPSNAVPRNQQQWFIFGPWRFDVEKAHQIIAERRRSLRSIPVTAWAISYGLAARPGGEVSLIGPGPGFDPDYAMTVDLSRPVIVATLRAPAGHPLPILIDGCHRLYRAAAEGHTTLPAYLLTAAETADVLSDTYLI